MMGWYFTLLCIMLRTFFLSEFDLKVIAQPMLTSQIVNVTVRMKEMAHMFIIIATLVSNGGAGRM